MTRVRGSGGRDKWNARQFSAKVGGVALPIFRMVQDGVNVMEDVPLGDGPVGVADAELFERPAGNVLAPVGAVLNPNWYCSELRSYISGTYCLRLVFAAFFL